MSPRHAERDRFGIALGVVVAVLAVLAIVVPVVLVRGGGPGEALPTPPAGLPLSGSNASAPESPAGTAAGVGSILPTPRGTTPAPPSTSGPSPSAPTPAPARSTPSATPTPGPTSAPAGVRAVAWNDGLCLGTGDPAATAGSVVGQQPCGSGQARRLRWEAGTLVDTTSGLCVDVQGASPDDGAPVLLWTCNGQGNQQFTPRPVPDSGGRVQLVAGHSGKCLDVAGTSVQQYRCHGADAEPTLRNQSWQLG